jgi:hypothetical protein
MTQQRIQEEQDQLDYMTINSTWFRLHQTTESGALIDITENAKDGIRKAIDDYRSAIGHLNTWE